MEFRPFGREVNGERIQDVSGLTVLANLEYLEQVVITRDGKEAGEKTIQALVKFLNERIPDGAYHVTPEFLKNPWNSYSYEFVMFLNEVCVRLSGDPNFHCNLGRQKVLSPIVQALGRPFSITQIYKLWPYFAEKFTKGALLPQIVTVTNGRAVMRLQFSERTSRQFGVYFKGCAERICQTIKSAIAEVPALMFGLPSAIIQDRCCMSDGAEYCEWIFTWQPQKSRWMIWPLGGLLLGVVMVLILRTWVPELSHLQAIGIAILPAFIIWSGGILWKNRREIQEKGKIIQEQLQAAETRHEELRGAYLTQEQITLDLRRRIAELTMLHQMGLCLGSTLERETLIEVGLQAITKELRYARAMIAFYDGGGDLAHDVHVVGVSKDLANRVRHQTMPIAEDDGLESRVLKQGMPVLIEDIHEALPCLHPHLQQFIAKLGTKTFIAVPLKVQNRILGALVADRLEPHSLTSQDMSVLSTLANHMAIALDNANAYAEIEQLNIGLESKVHERTVELQQVNVELQTANERLKELDQLKSQFLSHCSHELRTPLTAIKGFAERLFQETQGRVSERQQLCLTRINANADRLTRMIADLLDLARIESGTLHMVQTRVALPELLHEVLEQLHFMAQPKGQTLRLTCPHDSLTIVGDPDRLQQIVTNLVHNALKFTPENGTVSVELCRDSLTTIMMVVSDTGPGIPDHVLCNLFEPFFQAHRDVDRGNRGLGLGLTIVKNLVDLHAGSITVESQLGKGTTFRVTLPREQISTLDPPKPKL
jgi:signal transduction histidine kinase